MRARVAPRVGDRRKTFRSEAGSALARRGVRAGRLRDPADRDRIPGQFGAGLAGRFADRSRAGPGASRDGGPGDDGVRAVALVAAARWALVAGVVGRRAVARAVFVFDLRARASRARARGGDAASHAFARAGRGIDGDVGAFV